MTLKKKADYTVVTAKTEEEWLKNRRVYLTASDTASAIGISKWKSPLELWGEKTGLRQPKDLSNNEYVLRGKARENIIRTKFEQMHLGIKVTHHPYDIYVSNREGYGMLGASLDGELEVFADNQWNLPIGYKGVLEIKTVTASDYNIETINDWLNGVAPEHYRAQVHQQIFCYGADFALIQPEFDYGEGSEERYVMGEPILIEADRCLFDIEDTVSKARAFWSYVETKTPPPSIIEAKVEQTTEIVPILADAEVGSFYQNFDAVKKSIEDIVEPYRGVQFTEDQQKDAKEIKANLNKMAKEIDQKRIAVKKKYLQPLEIFESKANELKKVITDVIAPISEQIEEFENQRLHEKEYLIEGLIAEIVTAKLAPDMALFLESAGGVTRDKKWLNKGAKEADIRKDIAEQIETFKTSYESIIAFASGDSELLSMMLSEFARTKDLASAMKAKERIEASREQAKRAKEELDRQAEELKAKMRARREEEEARQKAKEEQRAIYNLMAEPVRTPIPETPTDRVMNFARQELDAQITFTFRATHPSKAEWKGLIAYMKEHGFTYEKLDR